MFSRGLALTIGLLIAGSGAAAASVVAKVDLVLKYVTPPPAAPVDAGTDAPWRPTLR